MATFVGISGGGPTFTYSGPYTAARFVSDIFNSAWGAALQAQQLLAVNTGALTAAGDQAIGYIDGKRRTGKHLENIQVERDYTPELNAVEADEAELAAEALRQHLQDQLKDMLRTFMLDYFPFYQIPDGSDAWERVAGTFDNQKLEGGIDLVRQRISGAWAERGIAIPAVALDAQRRSVEKAATDASAQSVRAQELIRLRELKAMDLIRFEQVNRQQTEALEAARAFLLSTLLPMSRKVSEDQDRITDYKRAHMDAYYRYMDTLLAADEAELARLVFDRSNETDRQITTDARKLEVFRRQAAVLEDEIQTLAQRASAAIARFGASTRIGGSEQMDTGS